MEFRIEVDYKTVLPAGIEDNKLSRLIVDFVFSQLQLLPGSPAGQRVIDQTYRAYTYRNGVGSSGNPYPEPTNPSEWSID